jgi:hypothetical protein
MNTDALVLGLLWGAEGIVPRRDGFPSWSWAGWQTGLRGFELIGRIKRLRYDISTLPTTKIAVQFENGVAMSWEDSKTEILARSQLEKAPPLLKIEGLMFDLVWTDIPVDSTKWRKMVIKRGPSPNVTVTAVIRGVQLTCQEMTASACKVVVLAVEKFYGIVLLVRKVPGKPYYERIGTLCSMYLSGKHLEVMSERTVRDTTGAKLEEILLA